MNEVTLSLPRMWADHHVVQVRAVVSDLPGVSYMLASALQRTLTLRYDSAEIDETAIRAHLAAAGYPEGTFSPDGSEVGADNWKTGIRTTKTNAADLAMSGDYRNY